MANALKYATSYGRALEQMYPYRLYFGALYNTPNNNRFRWVNSKSIEIPSIATTGRTNASRDSIGTAQRNYENDWELKTLVNQRKWSTLVHPKDIDQTNMVASIANITKVFNEEQKFPEMDAYCISKIYYDWTQQSMVPDSDTITAANVLAKFDAFMLAMDNARVPRAGRILYVTNEVKALMKNASGIDRTWSVQSSVNGVNREVETLDGIPVIPVPRELMQTAYVFTEGWTPAEGSQCINMMLIHPTAVITPVSYTFADLDTPTAVTEGKYYYYEESFEDVFILNNKKAAIQMNVTANPLSGLLAEAGTKASIFNVNVSDIQSGISISADGKITGTSKYLSGSNAITDVWGPGNFLYLKFTLPAGITYSDVKVGLVPSQGSGLVSLDADLDGIMKITDKNAQLFKMRIEKNGQIYEEGYDLTGLTCEQA